MAAIFEEFQRLAEIPARPGCRSCSRAAFCPGEATHVAVLDQLINHRFDVLHYWPLRLQLRRSAAVGLAFQTGPAACATAHELSRIDRVPRFVFSNACESGITPDRASARNALLAPSFAEAFFARGVSNFLAPRGQWTMPLRLLSRPVLPRPVGLLARPCAGICTRGDGSRS